MLLRRITCRGRAAYIISHKAVRALYVYESVRRPTTSRGRGAVQGVGATRVRIDEDVSTAAQRLRLHPRVVADDVVDSE